MKEKYFLVALVIGMICGVVGYIGYMLYAPSETVPTPTPTPTPTPPRWHLMLVRVFLWENGKEQFVASPQSDLTNYLLQTLPKVNLQGRCVLSEERIQEIKKNDKVIELSFRFYKVNITTGQFIELQDRDGIKTDENGYRILEKVKSALFILEDNLDEGLETHILVNSLTEGWSCWAIEQDGGLDKSWIEEIRGYLLTPVERYLTFRNGTETKVFLLLPRAKS